MSDMRIVILPQEGPTAPLCLTVDDGAIAWRRLHADEDMSGQPVALILPGIEAMARWLHLPTRDASQAQAAARLQWEDESALTGEALHLALGPLEADGHRLAVAVSRESLQAWLDVARAHGIEPDLVIPDHLALPPPPDGEIITARTSDGAVLVRGARLAFACEPAMLSALLGDRPVKNVDAAATARLLADGLRAPAINLLQGDFASRRANWRRDRRLRRVAVLAGLLLLSPLLLRLGEGAWLHFAAQGLKADSVALAAAVTPGPDPVGALAEQARRADLAMGGGPAGIMAQLFAALESQPDLQLEGLTMGADGVMAASVRHGSPGELESLTAALRGRGVAAAVTSSTPDAGRTLSIIRLGDTP